MHVMYICDEKGWVLWFQRVKAGMSDKPAFHTLESENPTFLMTTPVEKPVLNTYVMSSHLNAVRELVTQPSGIVG